MNGMVAFEVHTSPLEHCLLCFWHLLSKAVLPAASL